MKDEDKINQNLDETIKELYRIQRDIEEKEYNKMDSWWRSLSPEMREVAVHCVIRKLYSGAVEERLSLRNIVQISFELFDYSPDFKVKSGLFGIHSLIQSGLDLEMLQCASKLVVEGPDGEEVINIQLASDESIRYSLEDNDRILKIHIDRQT